MIHECIWDQCLHHDVKTQFCMSHLIESHMLHRRKLELRMSITSPVLSFTLQYIAQGCRNRILQWLKNKKIMKDHLNSFKTPIRKSTVDFSSKCFKNYKISVKVLQVLMSKNH